MVRPIRQIIPGTFKYRSGNVADDDRMARFKGLLAAAQRDVAAEPRLTADELRELGAIFDQAASDTQRAFLSENSPQEIAAALTAHYAQADTSPEVTP